MTMLLNEIDALLATPAAGEGAPSPARIERTLTDGYARALALDGERLRLQRRIAAVAAGPDENGGPNARELAALARLVSRADADLAHLRGVLALLRERFRAAPLGAKA